MMQNQFSGRQHSYLKHQLVRHRHKFFCKGIPERNRPPRYSSLRDRGIYRSPLCIFRQDGSVVPSPFQVKTNPFPSR